MRLRWVWIATLGAVVLVVLWLPGAQTDALRREQLQRWRSLGKAFYENPGTSHQAVEAFRKALELAPDSAVDRLNYALALLRAGRVEEAISQLQKVQQEDPSLPHTWFNLGIHYKNMGQLDLAREQFEQLIRLVPDEPISHYNLGTLYRSEGRLEEAIREFETAARLDPHLAAPHFQLFNIYRQQGAKELAERHLQMFKELRERQKTAPVPEDTNWSVYAEIYEPVEPAAVPAPVELSFVPVRRYPVTGPVAVLNDTVTGRLLLTAASGDRVVLYSPAGRPLGELQPKLGQIHALVPGDFTNDGLLDLCVLGRLGAGLFVRQGRAFEPADVKLPGDFYVTAVWLDYDHDNDLDLFLLGRRHRLFRNAWPSGFQDVTTWFPFEERAVTSALIYQLVPDSRGTDLIVTYEHGPAVLYRDLLIERFEKVPVTALPQGARALAVVDFDNDGWLDLLWGDGRQCGIAWNRRGEYEITSLGKATSVAAGDFDNRGVVDVATPSGFFRNVGGRRFQPVESRRIEGQIVGAVDLDLDGKVDLLAATGRELVWWRNRTRSAGNWLHVGLEGRKALRSATRAVVEVKAGLLYQKQLYQGLPLHFGLRTYRQVDAIRVTWPNGLVQNSTQQAARRHYHYVEQERISGSCPIVWAWDGTRFQFVGDILGVAPLGVRSGSGFFVPNSVEAMLFPAGLPQPRLGRYEVRLTQELAEVAYIDRVKLLVVDHPASVEIYTNQQFRLPPFPPLRLYPIGTKHYPRKAALIPGGDVLELLRQRDQRYADRLPLAPRPGVAQAHTLELEFSPGLPVERALLVLHGWTDWADGSTYLGLSHQRAGGLQFPRVEVWERAGRWRTVFESAGVPSGSPRPIVIELQQLLDRSKPAVRLTTNMRLYWDEVFIGEHRSDVPLRVHELEPALAELRFRGWSQIFRHPSGRQPQLFLYERLSLEAPWDQTPGMYTRYGRVDELLQEVDDRMVIMGSGDELRLEFPARLPGLPNGWTRTFLLVVHGWVKDQDPNTMYSWSVEPLPYQRMSGYPYSETEGYPSDPEHQRYLREYNTRPALRLNKRPLLTSGR